MVESGLFTFFYRLAQAYVWTKTKAFFQSCTLRFFITCPLIYFFKKLPVLCQSNFCLETATAWTSHSRPSCLSPRTHTCRQASGWNHLWRQSKMPKNIIWYYYVFQDYIFCLLGQCNIFCGAGCNVSALYVVMQLNALFNIECIKYQENQRVKRDEEDCQHCQ